MKVAVLREMAQGERRVAITPATIVLLKRDGIDVSVQAGAGERAFFSDEAYRTAGADVVSDVADALVGADVVVAVDPPPLAGVEGKVVLCMLDAMSNGPAVRELAGANVTSFALELMPRITRAQAMDVRSSQSTVAGYRAVIDAVAALAKMTPMLMTAAGTIRPANALVIGGGVAGLQAIATARRLGCVVTGVDVRPAVREQIESLGARFVALDVAHEAEDTGGYATDLGEEFYRGEQEILAPHVKQAHMIITTALVPGRPAPKLITEDMVATMPGGSVIVDLAAAAGGNCTLSRPGEAVVHGSVTILAPLNLPSESPIDASNMYSSNVAAFLGEILGDDGKLNIDTDNEIIRGTLVTRAGEIVHEGVRAALEKAGD